MSKNREIISVFLFFFNDFEFDDIRFCSIGVELVLSDFEKVSSGRSDIDKKKIKSESDQGKSCKCGNFYHFSQKDFLSIFDQKSFES